MQGFFYTEYRLSFGRFQNSTNTRTKMPVFFRIHNIFLICLKKVSGTKSAAVINVFTPPDIFPQPAFFILNQCLKSFLPLTLINIDIMAV